MALPKPPSPQRAKEVVNSLTGGMVVTLKELFRPNQTGAVPPRA